MTKSRNLNKPKHQWTLIEDAMILACYPYSTAGALVKVIGCTKTALYQRAHKLGLEKSQWFKDSILASRLRRGGNIGIEFRFKKGQVPPNKGVKGISYPGCVATQFKPGQKPASWRPLGSERLTKDGYWQVKMTDTGYPPRDWVGKHIVIWERLHGRPLPQGHMVAFRDGDRLNFSPENLEMLSRSENMKRNSFHNYGPDIAKLYQLKGALTRQINKREKGGNDE